MEKEELIGLVKKSQSGDMQAAEALLQAAYTPVSFQCRKMLKNQQDAEDVTQEVLLALYTKLDTLQEPAAFWGWMNRITTTRCMNALSRNHVDLQILEDEEGHSMLDDIENTDQQLVPDAAIDNAETTRIFEEMVGALPEAQRMCVLMFYYDEMSVKEIAEVMETSENTVKSRLNYARKAIKEQVLDYERAGTKLYGLSPLPFLLFFLRKAAEGSADGKAAKAMAARVMEIGAASGTAAGADGEAGPAAAGSAAATGSGAAAGTAAAQILSGLSIKTVAGVLAGLLVISGVTAGITAAVSNKNDQPAENVTVIETEPEEESMETAASEEIPEEEAEPEISEEQRAQRAAYISSLPYTGDPAGCALTGDQAEAFAAILDECVLESQSIERYDTNMQVYSSTFCRAALFDAGNGIPALWVMEGNLLLFNSDYEPSRLKIYYWDGTQAVLAVDYVSRSPYIGNSIFSCDLTDQGLLLRCEGGIMEGYGGKMGASMYDSSEIYEVSGGGVSEEPLHVLEKFTMAVEESRRDEYVKEFTIIEGYDIDYDYNTLSGDKWRKDFDETSPYSYLYCVDGIFCSGDTFYANGQDHIFWNDMGYGTGDDCELGAGVNYGRNSYWTGNWADAEEAAGILRSGLDGADTGLAPEGSAEEAERMEEEAVDTGEWEITEKTYPTVKPFAYENGKIHHMELDPREYNLTVFYEIPVFNEQGEVYDQLNAFFRKMEEDFWSSKNRTLAQVKQAVIKDCPDEENLYFYRNTARIDDWTDKFVSIHTGHGLYMGEAEDYRYAGYNFRLDTGERLYLNDMIDGSDTEIRKLIMDTLRQNDPELESTRPDVFQMIRNINIEDICFYVTDGVITVSMKIEGDVNDIRTELPVSLKAEWK